MEGFCYSVSCNLYLVYVKGRLVIGDNNELKARLLYQCHNLALGGHLGVKAPTNVQSNTSTTWV